MLVFLLLLSSALASDTWTSVRDGITLLHRTTAEPQDLWVAVIDLSLENIGLHASADATGTERHVTTPTFAASVDAVVAINGDWSDGTTPVGLAISDGNQWHDHIADDTLSGTWGFLACTASKTCTLSGELPLDEAWWFGIPTIRPYRYFQAVGANGCLLVQDGLAASGCYDSVDNPRSAAGLDATGRYLYLVAIDGRSSSAAGMSCDDVRDLMIELGAWDAVMLDGGGSTTLVVDGEVVNNPSDGSPRTVANHFGVFVSETIDSRCEVSNGRWCTGTVIAGCQGGRYLGNGDCGYYGCGCEEDADWAYCVHPSCPDGDGQGARCLDGTNIESCTDGVYGTGDCGVFGLACGADSQGAGCMDTRCASGPHSAFCASKAVIGACTDGTYGETACPAGAICVAKGETASCLDERCLEAEVCRSDIWISCATGVYVETDCSLNGQECSETERGCVDRDKTGDETGVDTTNDTDAPGRPGDRVKYDEEAGCGCVTGSPQGVWTLLLGLLLFRLPKRGSSRRP